MSSFSLKELVESETEKKKSRLVPSRAEWTKLMLDITYSRPAQRMRRGRTRFWVKETTTSTASSRRVCIDGFCNSAALGLHRIDVPPTQTSEEVGPSRKSQVNPGDVTTQTTSDSQVNEGRALPGDEKHADAANAQTYEHGVPVDLEETQR